MKVVTLGEVVGNGVCVLVRCGGVVEEMKPLWRGVNEGSLHVVRIFCAFRALIIAV